jgi:arylsulfatase A-like enzyme
LNDDDSRVAQRKLFRTVNTVGFLLAAFVLAAFVTILVSRGGSRSQANVIFIAVDTLRADRLGCYGATGGLTPSIDAIAAQSTRFTRTLSPCNSTSSSFASLHTGTYLKTHGVIQLSTFGYKLEPKFQTFAEYLKDEGYFTLGAVSAEHLNGEISGLGQGFDRYLDYVPPDANEPKQPAAVTTDRVLAALKERQASSDAKKPLFLFVHYFDPHWPYLPPQEFEDRHWKGDRPDRGLRTSTKAEDEVEQRKWKDFFVSQYEAEVQYVDQEIGRLVAGLREMGLWNRAFVIFTADHGENLGEHDLYFNHERMYRQVTNVPMLVRLPGQSTAVVSDALVQGVDLMPTALDAVGAPVRRDAVDGTSLMPLLEGTRRWVHQEIYSEGAGEKEQVCQNEKHKLTHLGLPHHSERRRNELYALASDPGETKNLWFDEAGASARNVLWRSLLDFVGKREIHVRFGPTGAVRRYRASIRGLASAIDPPETIGFEADDSVRVEASGEIVVECSAGGGDADEVKLVLDDSASLSFAGSADGAPLAGGDIAIDGHPFERTGLAYVVDWDPADPALATAKTSAAPRAALTREAPSDGGGEGPALRLEVGTSDNSERVHARIIGLVTTVDVPEGGKLVRSADDQRLNVDAPPPRASFRFSLAPGETRVFVDPRIGDGKDTPAPKLSPADLAVRFPIRFVRPDLPIPFVYSANYQFTLGGDEAGKTQAPVEIFRIGGYFKPPVDPSQLTPEQRQRMKALGYLKGG